MSVVDMDRPTITMSMDYIIWMLDHPDELSEEEKFWIENFIELWKDGEK